MIEHEMELGKEGRCFGKLFERSHNAWDISDFKVIMWVDGSQETNITDALSMPDLEYFRMKFIKDFLDNFPQGAA